LRPSVVCSEAPRRFRAEQAPVSTTNQGACPRSAHLRTAAARGPAAILRSLRTTTVSAAAKAVRASECHRCQYLGQLLFLLDSELSARQLADVLSLSAAPSPSLSAGRFRALPTLVRFLKPKPPGEITHYKRRQPNHKQPHVCLRTQGPRPVAYRLWPVRRPCWPRDSPCPPC